MKSQFTGFQLRSVVMPIVIINIIVFVLQMFLDNLGIPFTNTFALISEDVFTRPYILFTSMFLHADFAHILFNMYGLFIFGPLLEQKIGPKRFLLVYIGSGLLAAFASSFFYKAALGASGAIMGMLGALIILMPNLRLLLFFAIPMPLWVAGIIWAGIDIFGVFNPGRTANIAHLVGMGSGLISGLYFKGRRRKFNKRFEGKTHLEYDEIDDFLRNGRL